VQHLGDAATGLPADQIACMAIERELQRLKAVRDHRGEGEMWKRHS
jgi:hypothetical protein